IGWSGRQDLNPRFPRVGSSFRRGSQRRWRGQLELASERADGIDARLTFRSRSTGGSPGSQTGRSDRNLSERIHDRRRRRRRVQDLVLAGAIRDGGYGVVGLGYERTTVRLHLRKTLRPRLVVAIYIDAVKNIANRALELPGVDRTLGQVVVELPTSRVRSDREREIFGLRRIRRQGVRRQFPVEPGRMTDHRDDEQHSEEKEDDADGIRNDSTHAQPPNPANRQSRAS